MMRVAIILALLVAPARAWGEPAPADVASWRRLALHEALAAIEAIELPHERALLLVDLAQMAAASETAAGERGIFVRAQDAIAAVDVVPMRDALLRELATARIRNGDLDAALSIAATISDPRSSTRVRVLAARGFAALGDMARAQSLAGNLDDQGAAGEVLRELVVRSARRQDFAAALGIAAGIEDRAARAMALGDIGSAHARFGDAGDFSEAWRIASAVWPAEERTRVQAYVAAAAADAGQISTAETMGAAIRDPIDRAVTLSSIARGQARQGAAAAATRSFRAAATLLLAPRTVMRSQFALCDLARYQLDADDRDAALRSLAQALAAMSAIREQGERDALLSTIARLQGSARDWRAAVATTGLVGVEAARALLARDLAAAALDAGGADAATALAAQFEQPVVRAAALFGILSELQQPSDRAAVVATLAETARVAKEIAQPGERARAWASLAAVHLRSGEEVAASGAFDQSMALARSIVEPRPRAQAFVDIFNALVRR